MITSELVKTRRNLRLGRDDAEIEVLSRRWGGTWSGERSQARRRRVLGLSQDAAIHQGENPDGR